MRRSTGRAGHPKNIIFLTADAFGVMPPIAKLDPNQAMYHFLSGYTAKVAGTEKGLVGVQPEFSTCFGAPFLPRHPSVYADLLKEYISKHKVDCWLVNSGWTGGKYGEGRRMPIKATRTLLTAALDGSLKDADFRTDPYFGFSVPTSVPGVEPHLLNPIKTWKDKAEFDKTARALVAHVPEELHQVRKPRHARHQGGGAGSADRGGVSRGQCRRRKPAIAVIGPTAAWSRAFPDGEPVSTSPGNAIRVAARLGEDVGAEGLEALLSGIAQVIQAEEIFDAAQHRKMIVVDLRHRILGDIARQQHRADAAAAGAGDAGADVVDGAEDLRPRLIFGRSARRSRR